MVENRAKRHAVLLLEQLPGFIILFNLLAEIPRTLTFAGSFLK